MPPADPRLLAMQLQANTGQIPEVVTDTAPVYKVGDQQAILGVEQRHAGTQGGHR